jgi:hypothetical protein
MMSEIDSRYWQISTGLHFQNGHHNEIFQCWRINSGHHYLPTYQILMISGNVEFLPPIFYTVFWQTSRKFWKLLFIKSPKQSLGDLLFLLRFLLLFSFSFSFLSTDHELVYGRSQELLDRISWNFVEL